MGQYYRVLMKKDGNVVVNDRKIVDQDYMVAKLTEHSYLGNSLMMAVAMKLECGPMRLAWVGDYAKECGEDDVKKVTKGEVEFEQVWGDATENGKDKQLPLSHAFPLVTSFGYSGKFFVNHTKMEYVSFDDYIKRSMPESVDSAREPPQKCVGWCISPVSILTAVGNDRGGGDYRDDHPCFDMVGRWAWDELEIVPKRPSLQYKKLDVFFKE